MAYRHLGGADLDALAERVLDFQDRYNTAAVPFDWTNTREGLNASLRRLDDHDQSITAGRPAWPPTNLRP